MLRDEKVHPLIEAREKSGTRLVALTGYLGGPERSRVKLYPDLSSSDYYEIEEKDILHWEYVDSAKSGGLLRVFMPESAVVRFQSASRASELEFDDPRDRRLPRPGPRRPEPILPRPLPPSGPTTCAGACEQRYCRSMALANGLTDPQARAEQIRRANEALLRCLMRCGYTGFELAIRFGLIQQRCGNARLEVEPKGGPDPLPIPEPDPPCPWCEE